MNASGRTRRAWRGARSVLLTGLLIVGLEITVLLDNAFAADPAQWGVIAYLSGQGGLELEADGYRRAVLDAAAAGRCVAAVQIDGPHVAARWLVDSERPPVFEPLGKVNMGAQGTLEQFVSWAAGHLIADRYLLMVMGHGTGLATLSPKLSGVAFDGGTHDALTIPALHGALAGAGMAQRPLAMVCLDSCYGASLEVAYRLRGVAGYLVASPSRVPSPGLPWHQVLPLVDTYDDSHALGAALSKHYRGELVGVDLTKVANVASRLAELSEAISGDLRLNAPALRLVRSRTPSWGYRDEMCDLLSLADGLSESAASADVAERAAALAGSLRLMVGRSDGDDAVGTNYQVGHIGLFFPPTWERVPPSYRDTYDLASDTGWADLLQKHYETVDGFALAGCRASCADGASDDCPSSFGSHTQSVFHLAATTL